MKEKHLNEALRITQEIEDLRQARELAATHVWSICKIGNSAAEHEFASVFLGAKEDVIARLAREALLSDIEKQIAERRARLKEIGVELEEEKKPEQLPAPVELEKAA